MDTFRKQETLKQYFDQSYGCAAFSSVAKGGLFFVGGAYGAGDIYKLQHGEAEHVGKYRTSGGSYFLLSRCFKYTTAV